MFSLVPSAALKVLLSLLEAYGLLFEAVIGDLNFKNVS